MLDVAVLLIVCLLNLHILLKTYSVPCWEGKKRMMKKSNLACTYIQPYTNWLIKWLNTVFSLFRNISKFWIPSQPWLSISHTGTHTTNCSVPAVVDENMNFLFLFFCFLFFFLLFTILSHTIKKNIKNCHHSAVGLQLIE